MNNELPILVMLVAAGVLFAVSVFRVPFVAQQPIIPRLLITVCMSSVIGLGLYWFYWWGPVG